MDTFRKQATKLREQVAKQQQVISLSAPHPSPSLTLQFEKHQTLRVLDLLHIPTFSLSSPYDYLVDHCHLCIAYCNYDRRRAEVRHYIALDDAFEWFGV